MQIFNQELCGGYYAKENISSIRNNSDSYGFACSGWQPAHPGGWR
jgi:hypothetical protein